MFFSMELVGRFPTKEDMKKFKLDERSPVWLPSKSDPFDNFMKEEVIVHLRSVRKLMPMFIQYHL